MDSYPYNLEINHKLIKKLYDKLEKRGSFCRNEILEDLDIESGPRKDVLVKIAENTCISMCKILATIAINHHFVSEYATKKII